MVTQEAYKPILSVLSCTKNGFLFIPCLFQGKPTPQVASETQGELY